MSIENKIVIKDACILFDMIQLSMMDSFFELDLEVFTTQSVVDEVTDDHQAKTLQRYINNGKISIDSFGNDDFIFQLAMENRGLSVVDCSVIDLAVRKNGILLSSDNSLRTQAIRRTVEVHGILWIINLLVEEKIISNEMGIQKLQSYERINPRAPKKDLNDLVEKLVQKIML